MRSSRRGRAPTRSARTRSATISANNRNRSVALRLPA
jgi:hypothetical protein